MIDGRDEAGSVRRDGRADRWRTHRLARRAEFVDAAFRALDKHGPHAGMADIAREAGVAKPRLYRHFADKAELHAAVSERAVALVRERLAPALAEPAPFAVMVRRGVRAYIRVLGEHPNVFRFVCDGGAPSASTVAAMLAEVLTGLGVGSPGARAWAHGIVGAVQAIGTWWLDQRGHGDEPGEDISEDSVVDYLSTLVGGGLAAVAQSEGITIGEDEPIEQARRPGNAQRPAR
ncbi:TetR/AcrR family transcriptional regulator [Saccharomonospora sp. NPDC006951]